MNPSRTRATRPLTRSDRRVDPADVKRRLDCREVAETLGVRFRSRRGAWWRGHCFDDGAHRHGDRTPSLSVSADGYRCHGCGMSGDVIGLVMALQGLSFSDALADLAGTVTLARPPRPMTPRPPERSVEQTAATRALMSSIWTIVQDAPFSAATSAYLTGRGLMPDVAYALGCRDWGAVAGELAALFESTPPDDLVAAGLARSDTHALKLWWPLDAMLRGDQGLAGLAVPVWWPEHDAPIAWRWRVHRPELVGDRKSLAMYATPDAPAPVLGLRRCLRLEAGPAMSWVGTSRVIIVAEGEPDWWALQEAFGSLAAVVSVAATSRRWESAWTRRYLSHARLVAVVMHARTAPKVAEAIGLSLVELHGREEAERRFCRYSLPDGDAPEDANDKHNNGTLHQWLEPLVTRAEEVTRGA